MEYYSDKNLSIEAKGILSELLCGSTNDVVEPHDLTKICENDSHKRSRWIGELFRRGYLVPLGADKGRFYFEALENNREEE